MISEEVLNLVEDNVHAGDINTQRVRIMINDQAIHADPKEMRNHILCGIAHLQSAADYLETYVANNNGGKS